MLGLLFKKEEKAMRYSISAELIKGEERVITMFSPLVRSRARGMEYVMLVAERRGYEGAKFLN